MLQALAFASALSLPVQVAQPQHARETIHPDATVYTMPADGKPARIPFRLAANQVRVEAVIDGAGPFHLILDTGMPTPGIILFQSERVAALRFAESGESVALRGAGGAGASFDARIATGVSVSLGDLKMSHVTAMVLPDQPRFPPGIDGIIGGALFYRFIVRLDVDQNLLELFEPAGWSPPDGACVVPLHRVAGAAFVDVRVAVGEGAPVPARVVLDLGASHAISLNQGEGGRCAPPPNAIDAPLGRGLSGVVLGKVGRVRRLEIGTFAFEKVVASFPIEEHQHPGDFPFRDGNLGAEILKRFRVSFDYPASRLVLEKGKGYGELFEREMAGIGFDWTKDRTVVVHTVLAGSPAAAAGFEVGDQILSLDGRSLEELAENGLRRALTVDGAEVRFALRRGDQVLEKRVRLRRLI